MDWRQSGAYLGTFAVTLALIAAAAQTGAFARVVDHPRLAAASVPGATATPEPARPAQFPTTAPTLTATPLATASATATVTPTRTPAPPTATPESTVTPTPEPTATPEPSPTPTVEVGSIHTIEKGETLFTIAIRYGFTTGELARANNITDATKIYYGQQLIIPKR